MLHPLVLRAAEVLEQEAFLNDVIAKVRAAGALDARRAQEPFPSLHDGMRELLLREGPRGFYKQFLPLFAGFARRPSADIFLGDHWERFPALPVPAEDKEWFKAEVDVVLHSVGLASEAALHSNPQYEQLVGLMFLWPDPIKDARELPLLPQGFGLEDDGRTPPQVSPEPDIRPGMREAANRVRGCLQEPWQQYGPSPYGSSMRSKRDQETRDAAKVQAGRIAHELNTKKGVALSDLPDHPDFERALKILHGAKVRLDLDPACEHGAKRPLRLRRSRSPEANAAWVARLIERYRKEHPEAEGLRPGPRGPRW